MDAENARGSGRRVPLTDEEIAERNAIVEAHLELIRPIARRIARTLPPSFDIDELSQAGALGLIAAVSDFDPSRGLTFATYAGWRIKFAVLSWVQDSWSAATAAPLDPRMPDWRPNALACMMAAVPVEIGPAVRRRVLQAMANPRRRRAA